MSAAKFTRYATQEEIRQRHRSAEKSNHGGDHNKHGYNEKNKGGEGGKQQTVARVQLRSADKTSEPRLKMQNTRRTRAHWLWLDRFSVGRSDG